MQEASDVLGYSRFRVCELLTASAGRVLVTDVLALKSFVAPSALDAAPLLSPPLKVQRGVSWTVSSDSEWRRP